MPHLRIVYDIDGWAHHNCALGLRRYAPADFTVSMVARDDASGRRPLEEVLGDVPPDVLLLLPPRPDGSYAGLVRAGLRDAGWRRTRLIAAWSQGWPLGLDTLHVLREHADAVLTANHEFWERAGRLPRTYPRPYGVDPAVFRVRTPTDRRIPRVVWTGSEQHRKVKGYDDYIEPLFATLRARGVACEAWLVDSRGPARRTREQMAAWYDGATVLVCASEAEGTPNPALEAAASGCTVVSTRVGNMPELIRHGENGLLVDRDPEALLRGVEAALADAPLAARMQRDIRAWWWSQRAPSFFTLFRELATHA
jgi:glycosyltransferase involved in cell wall biosynthesis